MREHDLEPVGRGRPAKNRRKRRFDDDEPHFLKRSRHEPPVFDTTDTGTPDTVDRWSTWAIDLVEQWPDDITQAEPSWETLQQMADVADMFAARIAARAEN